MKNSLAYLVQQLLKQNAIIFDIEELTFQIESHPSYPSLHAITGVLDHFNIDNLALDVPVTDETLRQLPKSFLAQINMDDDDMFAVVKNKGLIYEVLYDSKKKVNLSISEFQEKFTGILVVVEKGEEFEFKNKFKNDFIKKAGIISAVFFSIHFALLNPSISNVLFFIASLIGIYVSYAIFRQEQGEESFLGNAFCSDDNEKKDCNAVLNSKGAKIFKNYKLSNLSLAYFSGLALSSYLLTLLKTDLSFLFLMSIIAIPITLYSLYYQYAILKQWCLLCLSIVVVLWVQSLIAVVNFETIHFSYVNNLVVVCFSFSLAFVIGQFVFSFVKTKKKLRKTKMEYFKFKRNFNLFNTLLEKSEVVNTTLNVPEIIVGNKNSNLNITVITNPFCGHCKAVHTLVENIYKKYPNEVSLCIRFNVNVTNVESDAVKITTRLLELFEKNSDTCLNAMHGIYEGMNPDNWIEKWENCYAHSHYIKILAKQSDWCINNTINFTPEILINGKSFPKEYDRNDLLFFIEDINEMILENYSMERPLESQVKNEFV